MAEVASILNPIFEEFLWLGYLVHRLTPRLGVNAACAVSMALRVSLHA
jgi:membrane protease YdiL (CAAX protease family)